MAADVVMMDDPNLGEGSKQYENTYIMEPEGYGEGVKFQRHKVMAILNAVVDEHVKGNDYDGRKGPSLSKMLADSVLTKVKELGYTRYKIIVQVTVGQRLGQAMRVVSRALWNVKTDSFASVSYESHTMYCVINVFGLYFE